MTNKAVISLSVKALDDDKREIEGWATRPEEDRVGDIVLPRGAEYRLPIPFLLDHDHRKAVGEVDRVEVTDKGIRFWAHIKKIAEEGEVKKMCDDAWALVKNGLRKSVSIGFRPLDAEQIPGSYGIKVKKWEWLELSAVTVPALASARITSAKHIDAGATFTTVSDDTAKSIADEGAAASGTSLRIDNPAEKSAPPPGVSGTPKQPASGGLFYSRTKEKSIMNVQEQIKRLTDMRTQKALEMSGIQEKALTEGRTKDSAEREAFDGFAAEIKQIDEELADLRQIEALNVAKAVPAVGGDQTTAAVSRGALATGGAPAIHVSKDADEKFQGQNYTRMVIAKALSRLSDGDLSPVAIAEQRWGKSNPTLLAIMKAAVPGGGSGSGEWGAELVTANNRYMGDFIEFLHSMTVYDKLPLRAVPANVQIKGQDGAATGYWVGESKAIPATAADFMAVNLTPLKVAALAVVSNELLRDSSPAAEMLVRDALVHASSQRVDATFLSTAAASAGVSPAGILNGLTAITSNGTDGAGLRADIKALYAPFITAKNADGLQLVTTPSLGKAIQLMTNALGQVEFPGISANGGTLLGDPVTTGHNVGSGQVILLKPSDIYRIGDDGVQVSISREAMIEQNDAPTGATDTPVAGSVHMTSMFQSESTAIKVVRSINFAKRRASAVAYVSGADYGAPEPETP